MIKRMTRRELLRVGGFGSMVAFLAACQPKVVEKIVEKEVTKVVKEVVKETVIVAGTPQVVEKEVTKIVKEVVEVVKEVTPEPAPKGKTEIIYYDRTTSASVWGEAFNEAQDEIELEVQIQPPGGRYEQLVAAITAGNAPDVIGLDCVQVGRFAELGALAPLQDMVPPETMDRYFQSLVRRSRHFGFYEGDVFGVPFWLDMSLIYYDKSLLEEVGGDPEVGFLTWNDILTYGKAATKEGRFGMSLGRVNGFLWGPYVWAQDGGTGDWLDWDTRKSLILEKPYITNAFNFFHDAVHVDKITNDAAGTDWGAMNDLFTGGRAMMVNGGGGLTGLIRNEFPELWENLGVCLIPGPEEGDNSSYIGGNVASITRQSKEKEGALEVLTWLTASKKGQATTGEVGFLPGTPEGLELSVFKKDWHIYSVFKQGLDTGYPASNDPVWIESREPCDTAFQKMLVGDVPVDQLLAKAHPEVQDILNR